MPFEMSLWRVVGETLKRVDSSPLDNEERLENWIAEDPSILGLDLALIGRQVRTPFGGRIDLLALDGEANCVILELKKGRTPRDVVAQTLDYASWVMSLGYADLEVIAQDWKKVGVATLFEGTFGFGLPETVNEHHSMIVVASGMDESSERIISYLVEQHDVSINAVFFRFFRDEGGVEHLGRAWLEDPVETIERAESRKRIPTSDYWYVNVGEGEHRTWADNVRYGFIGAGQGSKYSRALLRLKPGDKIFAYMKRLGYVGHGVVASEAVTISAFLVEGTPLLDLDLEATKADENSDSPELAEWVVQVTWLKTFPRDQAKGFEGMFTNQNVVCRLSNRNGTVEFLEREFGVAKA